MKELMLSTPRALTYERDYRLGRGANIFDFKAIADAFRSLAFAAKEPSFTVTDEHGKSVYRSLGQLAQHLGRRRIAHFEIKAPAYWKWEFLTIRSDGSKVKVKVGAQNAAQANAILAKVIERLQLAPVGSSSPATKAAPPRPERSYDAFIAHASEDKATVVRPLRSALTKRNYRLWVDEFELRVGDSLRRKIEDGLRRSAHGIVVLSPKFFAKRWPHEELDALFTRELVERKKVILPVWHRVDVAEIKRRAPLIAGRLAANTADGIDQVARDLVRAMGRPLKTRTRSSSRGARSR